VGPHQGALLRLLLHLLRALLLTKWGCDHLGHPVVLTLVKAPATKWGFDHPARPRREGHLPVVK